MQFSSIFDEVEISVLANEELLAVFRFLPMSDLLQCRAVCHRWASLAQDPTLWSGRTAHTGAVEPSGVVMDTKLLAAILNFAPCLRELALSISSEAAHTLWSTLISTSCAISELRFTFFSADAVYAALIISRQASLGRLKEVELEVFDSPELFSSDRSPFSLLMHLSHTQGLEEISLEHSGHIMTNAFVEFARRLGGASAPVSASLKRLSTDDFDPFCELLLQWHADTLEHVCTFVPSASALAAPLLSRLPRLRLLACYPLKDMRALLQCPSLNTLELSLDDDPVFADNFPEACAFVRGLASTPLESFMLLFSATEDAAASQLLRCVEDTAAGLRCLWIQFTRRQGSGAPLYQHALAEVLHRLPLLTLLDLDSMPTPALLQQLDGRTVPELTQLLVRLTADDVSADCGHQFIHSEAVRTLLRNYPRLHIFMKEVHLLDGCACAFCKEGCHAVPRNAWRMLFGHEAGARCDVPHEWYYYDEAYHDCVAFHMSTN